MLHSVKRFRIKRLFKGRERESKGGFDFVRDQFIFFSPLFPVRSSRTKSAHHILRDSLLSNATGEGSRKPRKFLFFKTSSSSMMMTTKTPSELLTTTSKLLKTLRRTPFVSLGSVGSGFELEN